MRENRRVVRYDTATGKRDRDVVEFVCTRDPWAWFGLSSLFGNHSHGFEKDWEMEIEK